MFSYGGRAECHDLNSHIMWTVSWSAQYTYNVQTAAAAIDGIFHSFSSSFVHLPVSHLACLWRVGRRWGSLSSAKWRASPWNTVIYCRRFSTIQWTYDDGEFCSRAEPEPPADRPSQTAWHGRLAGPYIGGRADDDGDRLWFSATLWLIKAMRLFAMRLPASNNFNSQNNRLRRTARRHFKANK